MITNLYNFPYCPINDKSMSKSDRNILGRFTFDDGKYITISYRHQGNLYLLFQEEIESDNSKLIRLVPYGYKWLKLFETAQEKGIVRSWHFKDFCNINELPEIPSSQLDNLYEDEKKAAVKEQPQFQSTPCEYKAENGEKTTTTTGEHHAPTANATNKSAFKETSTISSNFKSPKISGDKIVCTLYGQKLSFSDNYLLRISSSKKFYNVSYDYFMRYRNLKRDSRNLDTLLEALPDFLNEIIINSLQEIQSILKSYDITELDSESIYNLYENSFDYSEKIMPIYNTYTALLRNESNIEEYYRNKSNQPHSQWVGGGFGIRGAVKGALTAGALNVGSSIMRGIGHSVVKGFNMAKINNKKDDIFKHPETDKLIRDAILKICRCIISVSEDIITKTYDNIQKPQIDFDAAATYHKAAMNLSYDFERRKKSLVLCIAQNPFEETYYCDIVDLLGDFNDEAKNIAILFIGSDIVGEYKEKIIDNLYYGIIKGKIDQLRNEYSNNVFANSILNSTDTNVFDDRLVEKINNDRVFDIIKFYDFIKDSDNTFILEAIGDYFVDPKTEYDLVDGANVYLNAAFKNSISCACKILKMYETNQVDINSIETINSLCFTIINNNNAEGLYWVAKLYLKGRGFSVDEQKGISLMHNSATLGYAPAMHYIGNAIIDSQPTEGVNWWVKAFNNGNIDSAWYIADTYEKGKHGIQKDISSAIEWYEKGVEAGDTDSMRELGHIYRQGVEVPENRNKALMLYQTAVNTGDADMNYYLAEMYESSDLKLAEKHYKDCWYFGKTWKAFSAFKLGQLYQLKFKDFQKAIVWFELAEATDDFYSYLNAKFSLAMMYARGQGVSVDYNKCGNLLNEILNNPNIDKIPNLKKFSTEKIERLKFSGGKWTKKAFSTI